MLLNFKKSFTGKKILVTGHTGFKGSWLSIWLRELGAHVVGYSLSPPSSPNHFTLTRLREKMTHIEGDICDDTQLKNTLEREKPELVFHLAAQALVIPSYTDPQRTFASNAMGMVNLLEAARYCPSLQAMVLITTDKCYENKEWLWGYRENDPLGGNDPYSASKAMAELAIASYRKSFFSKKGPLIASARAGNVIGGGDFSDYRIVPDTIKSLLEKRSVPIRNPHSIRPWLYVLDALKGYLQLAASLLQGKNEYAQAWNFGPYEKQGVSVETLVNNIISLWGEGNYTLVEQQNTQAEMHLLKLNWDKAATLLGWLPTYSWEETIQQTVDWFKFYQNSLSHPASFDFYKKSVDHIRAYETYKN